MAANQPFLWGANGQAISPEQLERQRKVAEALMAVQPKPQTMWEGIQSAIGQIGGSALNARADAQEKEARDQYGADYLALGDTPTTDQLEKLAGNSFANPGQQAVVQALLSQKMQQQSPDYQLDLDLKRAQIQAAQAKPEAERKTATDQNGVLRYLDTGEAAFPSVQPKPSGYRTLNANDATKMGLPPGSYQQDLGDQKIYQIGGGGTNVTVNSGDNSGAFAKKADELAATRFDDYIKAGTTAQSFTGDLNTLKDISTRITTGKTAEVEASLGPFAEALGIDISGLGDLQGYQAIVDKLAPNMRPTGSGSSSDVDVRMFLNSLPGLGKTPEGNALIIQTFQAVQDQKIKAAGIAQQAMIPKEQGGITWQEAEKQISALGDPYSEFKKAAKADATSDNKAPGTAAATVPVPAATRPKTVNTQAEYDALPSHTHYIDPDDGQEYVKP